MPLDNIYGSSDERDSALLLALLSAGNATPGQFSPAYSGIGGDVYRKPSRFIMRPMPVERPAPPQADIIRALDFTDPRLNFRRP